MEYSRHPRGFSNCTFPNKIADLAARCAQRSWIILLATNQESGKHGIIPIIAPVHIHGMKKLGIYHYPVILGSWQ